jgi:hypothetical protein
LTGNTVSPNIDALELTFQTWLDGWVLHLRLDGHTFRKGSTMTSQDSFYSSLDSLNKAFANAAQVLSKHPFKHSLYPLPAKVNEQLMHLWGISEVDYSDEGEENPKKPSYALGIGTSSNKTEGELIIFYDCCSDKWVEFSEGIRHEPAEVRIMVARQIPDMLRYYEALLSQSAKEVYELCSDIEMGIYHLSRAMEANTIKAAEQAEASEPQATKPQWQWVTKQKPGPKPKAKKTIEVEYAPAKPVEKKTIEVEYAPAKPVASKPQAKKPKS